jgi:murein DD-endopeptidase MepM/ murein hydrolase activator NlpD
MASKMDPLLRGAWALSLVALLTRAAELHKPMPGSSNTVSHAALDSPQSPSVLSAEAPCPRGTLPDGNVCIPVPDRDDVALALAEEQNEHRDRSGALRVDDEIPRRPDRPKDFRKYRLPVPVLADQSFVSSGYDLDRPDSEPRRGVELSAVGHGGVDLAQARGTEVRLVNLENQLGDARVLAVGHLFGNSVVTEHIVREAGALRQYLVIYGHLDRAADGLGFGQSLRAGALLGYVGDSGSIGAVHLLLEIRRAREGVDATQLALGQVNQNAKTVACDPRNVLERLP